MDWSSPDFWISVGQIILIDILLGGDNAVVIALACRKLPPEQRAKGVMWGVVGAVGARVVLIFFALQLLALPYLKAVGALLLLWIGIKLMLPEDEEGHGKLEGGSTLWSAVRTVIVADAVMSLDNVIAVAAAADGHLGLVVFGILVSVPIIVWGSKFVLLLIDRFPLVVVFGAALLGWIAGGMLVGDVAWKSWLEAQPGWLERAASAAGAAFVVVLGKLLVWRRRRALPPAPAGAAALPARIGRILVASDGSPGAAQALRQALALRGQLRDGAQAELHLANVQRPVSGNVASFVAAGSIEDYHRERADQALDDARRTLAEAGVAFQEHRRVGEPGETIAALAAELGCDLIVMGSRGLGTHTGALLGSVAAGTLEHAGVPVLVVRA
ncbi:MULTISPECIES: YjbE family putative metal transport protein [Piscinibacter]|uniref:YjbE family putative metal transport protein n=1 Tax=Piscinibacter TaxID=1114981 RepID=UPI002873ADF9|nr:YjbE family putative metal transport protein [Piscinibacter defluvii]